MSSPYLEFEQLECTLLLTGRLPSYEYYSRYIVLQLSLEKEQAPKQLTDPLLYITAEKKFRSQGHFGSAVIVTAASVTVGRGRGTQGSRAELGRPRRGKEWKG